MKQNRQLCPVPTNHPCIGASVPFSDRRFNVSHGRIHVLLEVYFSPSKCSELRPTVVDIDSLRVFPFLDSQPMIDGLKAELPAYLAAAEDVSTRKLRTIKSKIGSYTYKAK